MLMCRFLSLSPNIADGIFRVWYESIDRFCHVETFHPVTCLQNTEMAQNLSQKRQVACGIDPKIVRVPPQMIQTALGRRTRHLAQDAPQPQGFQPPQSARARPQKSARRNVDRQFSFLKRKRRAVAFTDWYVRVQPARDPRQVSKSIARSRTIHPRRLIAPIRENSLGHTHFKIVHPVLILWKHKSADSATQLFACLARRQQIIAEACYVLSFFETVVMGISM